MSILNDIENCISNAEKVRNFSKRFLPGHWTFMGLGFEKKWYGSSYDGQWARTANKMAQQFKETGHQRTESRNFETKERQKYHSLQRILHEHRTIISNNLFCESSQYLRGCYQLVLQICFEGGGKHIPTPVDHRILAIVEPEEVEMLTSSPNLAQGNLMMRSEAKFKVLEKKVRMTQLCEKALFQYLVTAGNRYKVRPDGEDGCGRITPWCRECVCSRVFPQAKKLGAFPAGTVIGPIWGSYCEHSWRIWIGSCDSINMQTWRRDLRCDIQRNRALCEWNSYSRSRSQIKWRIARKSSRIQRDHVSVTKRGTH